MGEEQKKTYIHLDAPYRIKYESVQEFDHSVFSSAYRQAASITREIIKKNREYHKSPKRKGNLYRNNEQIYNIISFEGDRGSGKTSCMLSYAEYLKDYHRIKRSEGSVSYDLGDHAVFIGINAIDAGLLEDKEDIVDVVLASLLGQFRKLEDEGRLVKGDDYEFRRREFNQCLHRLYESNLRRKQGGTDKEFASLKELQEMAVSVNMRDNIKELVDKYIALIRQRYVDEDFRETEYYVVIPIDDIDMNITNGYDMLEQIRRYLMVPNVIVMLSYRYEQLRDICDLYYVSRLRELGKICMEESEELKEKISKLSSCYMAKVVPRGRIILLPEMNNLDLFADDEVYIVPVGSEETVEKRREDAHSIHETILRKVSRCFSIRYPLAETGMKIWKADRLRDLCNLYDELHNLEDPEKSKGVNDAGNRKECEKRLREIYSKNYLWLIEYLKHRAELELGVDEYKRFERIMSQPLNKVNREIIKACEFFRQKNNRSIFKKSEEWKEESYGTSLYCLNWLEQENENLQFPAFVKAYLTALMGRIYFSESDHAKEKLEKILNKDRIMGSYNNKFFPEIRYQVKDRTLNSRVGYVKRFPLRLIIETDSSRREIEASKLKALEIFYMFLSNIKDTFFDMSTGRTELDVLTCDFGIFNFVWNILEYDVHLQKLYLTIKRFLIEEGWLEREAEDALTRAKKKSLLKEMRKWRHLYQEEYILPVCNTELMAFILRECENLYQQECIWMFEKTDNWLEINEIISRSAIGFMNKIYEILKTQDEYYEKARRADDSKCISLAEIFGTCPVVSYLREGASLIPPGMEIRLDRSETLINLGEEML